MDDKSQYRVNEDGSVTKIGGGGTGNSNNNSDGSGNGGCLWAVVIAIIVGIVIAVISNSNGSDSSYEPADSTAYDEVVEEVVAEEVSTPSTTYLRVSDDDLYFDASGGSENITIYTDGDWTVDVDVASWGRLTKYSDSVVLTVDENSSRNSRTDYFTLKSGSYTKRINITQSGNTSPSADIERIWLDHSVYQNGVKGMKIHVEFTVENMNGKTVYAYAYFYWGDNVTPLHDQYGNNLSFYGYGTSNYDSCRFNDFVIFVPYYGLNMSPNQGSVDISFDISVRNASGTELARNNNTQITFSN